MRAQLKGPTACVSYCALSLGILVLLVTFITSPWIHFIGLHSVFLDVPLQICYPPLHFSGRFRERLEGGLNDISETYHY